MAGVDDVLDAVSYHPEVLMHPVELLTIEQAADGADLPKTTINSAAGGTAHFRELVLAKSISRLRCEPGPDTWAALQRGLRSGSIHRSVAELLGARASELAADPAFAFFLSGFDRLDCTPIAATVDGVARHLVRCFVPFIETGISASSDEAPTAMRGDNAFVIMHLLLAEAFRRLMRFPADDAALDARLTANAATVLLSELGHEPSTEADWDAYFAPELPVWAGPDGKLGLAVSAGADLLLSGAMPLSTRMTVSDITTATGINVAAFYRRFGSIAGFERIMLERVGRGLIQAFNDEMFEELLERLRSGEIGAADALETFNSSATEALRRHVEEGRPGRQVLPWLGTAVGREVFTDAFRESVAYRAMFYDELSTLIGLPLAAGINGTTVASVLGTHSQISEMLIRNAPDRSAGFEVMQSRLPFVYATLFGSS